jgi:DNA polymerase/3'-5' exonuclease PolX
MAGETNQKISKIFCEMEELLVLKGVPYKPRAYQKASQSLLNLEKDASEIYSERGKKGLQEIPGIGKSMAEKIEEYLKAGKIKQLEELKEETAIRQIVTHYFESKGLSLLELKESAKKRKIVYSRYTKPAKQLLELAGSIEKAKEAIDKVASWAQSRKLDYAIETVFKKWLELSKLKPKEVVKKPFYDNNPMIWSQTKKKWFVIAPDGRWLEFAAKEKDIEWRIEE